MSGGRKKENYYCTGRLVFVTQRIRNKGDSYVVFARLQDALVTYDVVVMTPHLFHVLNGLSTSNCYTFTDCNKSLMNKGRSDQRLVYNTTASSQVFDNGTPVKEGGVSLSQQTNDLISYQGTVSCVLCNEGGLYELDQCTRLYLYYLHTPHNIDHGASITITRCHVLYIASPWKKLSGFVCCPISSIECCPHNSSYKGGFNPHKNRLTSFLSKFTAGDAAYLLQCYTTLRLHLSVTSTLVVLEQLSSPFNSPGQDDLIASVFTSPHSCHLMATPNTLLWKLIHSVRDIATSTTIATTGAVLSWQHSKSLCNKLLVGRLRCVGDAMRVCDQSGEVCIVHHRLWSECGNVVILYSYHVVTETITTYNNVLTRQYLYPITWSIPSTNDSMDTDRHIVYFMVSGRSVVHGDSTCVKVLTHDTLEALVTSGMPTIISFNKDSVHLRYNCCYTLSSPSPLPVRGHEILLTNDHNISMISGPSPSLVDVVDVCDVLRMCTALLPSNQQEQVSIKGCVLSQSLRVDSYPSGCHGDNNALHGYRGALHVSSLLTQDTMMVYLHGNALPLGLLPGAVALFYHLVVKKSKSGNTYCIANEGSSYDVLSFEGPTGCLGNVPRVWVADLMDHLLEGTLSRNVVQLRGIVVSVQQVTVSVVCGTCHSVMVSGCCSASCSDRRSVVDGEGRFLFDDGSGEAHVYASTQCMAALLTCTEAEWSTLTQHVEREGRIVFTRYHYNGKGYCRPEETAGYRLLLDLVQRHTVVRPVNITCQPFVSTAETRQGSKKVIVRSRHDNSQYTTTVLPRLQLKLKSLDDVNCIGECHKMLDIVLQK